MPLQHLRSSTAHKRPVPGNMSDGQLGINTNLASPGLFFKDSNNNLVKVGPVHVGSTAPNASPASGGTAGNSLGEQWLDTAGGTYVFKVWDGSAWRSESGTFVDVNGDVMTGALGIIAGSAGSPGLYFSGDTNTGIYSPGADQVAVATNSSQRISIDASGNVNIDSDTVYVDAVNNRLGIGTTSVTYNLEVAGTSPVIASNGSSSSQVIAIDSKKQLSGLRISGDVARVEATFFSGAGGGYTPLTFWTSDTERARIDSSGRLLVGTSTDFGGALLQVNGDRIRVGTAKTPASATATGTAGEICWDTSYLYVCTASNTWKRAALSTW